jgi:prepilin-type N-terminal cleavage/methylation domain-containing protein
MAVISLFSALGNDVWEDCRKLSKKVGYGDPMLSTAKPSQPSCRRSAFTLTELLVVIGIIAVLIAVLMPVLSKARAEANRTVCLSNIRQLGMGILMYCNDNSGYFPTCAYPSDGLDFVAMNDDWIWWQANRNLNDSAIAKYLAASGSALQRIFRCPSDTFDSRRPAVAIMAGQGPYLFSYNFNNALACNSLNPPVPTRTKITQWCSPSKRVVLTEIYERFSNSGGWDYGDGLARRHGSGPSPFAAGTTGITDGLEGAKVSTLFIDGHAEGVDEKFACNVFQDLANEQ